MEARLLFFSLLDILSTRVLFPAFPPNSEGLEEQRLTIQDPSIQRGVERKLHPVRRFRVVDLRRIRYRQSRDVGVNGARGASTCDVASTDIRRLRHSIRYPLDLSPGTAIEAP